jgi:hypothetical protein
MSYIYILPEIYEMSISFFKDSGIQQECVLGEHDKIASENFTMPAWWKAVSANSYA